MHLPSFAYRSLEVPVPRARRPRTGTWRYHLVVVLIAGCGSPSGEPAPDGPGTGDAATTTDGAADAFAGEELATTPDGTLYYVPGCTAPDTAAELLVFAPGTAVRPGQSTHVVRQLGRQSGACVIAIEYANNDSVAACCSTTTQPDGPQDAACLAAILSSKTSGVPATYDCIRGQGSQTPPGKSVEGATLAALVALDRTEHLEGTGDARRVRWDRIAIGGHSQGAMLAAYLGMARHRVARIASFAGGSLSVAGSPTGYLPYVTAPPATPATLHRAIHEKRDADAGRRRVYAAMGVPSANIRSLDGPPPCDTEPHACVALDAYVPLAGGVPVFAPDWWWAMGGP